MNRRTFLKGISILAAASADLFIPFAEAVQVPNLNFAHITDLHLDVNGESTWLYREKSVPLFINALQRLVRLPKLDFVVFGGDQIHYGPNDRDSLGVFQQWISHLNMPCYILLGNTEVSPVEKLSKLAKEDYLRAWAGRGLHPGHTSWTFDPVRGVHVIGFDVTVEGKPHGEADEAGLKWLEENLKANKSKKLIIIFTHHLLMPTSPRDLSPGWSFWMVKNHERVREVIGKYPNVRLVVSGHHHASKVETAGRTTYVSDPAVVTYPCSFRFFSITQAGIHLRNIGIDDKTIVDRAKELLESDPYAMIYDPENPGSVSAFSSGLTAQDREARIKL